MSLFPDHTFTVNISKDRSQQVVEKITGEFGKLVRENYDVRPFTGTVKEGKFKIMPNIPNTPVKLTGTIQGEGMGKTRITVQGKMSFGRIMILLLVLAGGFPLVGLFGFFSYENGEFIPAALGVSLILALILTVVIFAALGSPRSKYNEAVFELMRKLDKHDLVL